MPYVDPNTIHNPTTGGVPPAAWGDQVRDDLEFLVESPGCSVYKAAAVSTTSGSETVLVADSENYDLDTMHSTSSNTSRITCNTAGKYHFWATVSFAANSTGYRRVNCKVNGGSADTLMTMNAVTTGGPINTVIAVSWSQVLAVDDYVEISAAQLSGGALDVRLREFGCQYVAR